MWKWAAWHRDVTGNLQIWSPPGSRCFQKCFSRISICGRRRWRMLWWNYSPGSDTPKSALIRGYRGLVLDCAAGSDTYGGSMDAGDSVFSISTIVFSFDGCVALVSKMDAILLTAESWAPHPVRISVASINKTNLLFMVFYHLLRFHAVILSQYLPDTKKGLITYCLSILFNLYLQYIPQRLQPYIEEFCRVDLLFVKSRFCSVLNCRRCRGWIHIRSTAYKSIHSFLSSSSTVGQTISQPPPPSILSYLKL